MGWWSDLVDKVKEFFKGEEPEPDTSQYKDKEKELTDSLKDMHENFEATYDPSEGYEDLETILPEDPGYVYKEYTGDDEQTIKDNTTQKYNDMLNDEKGIVSNEYDGKVNELESKKEIVTAESNEDIKELDKEYAELEKQLKNSLVEKGLYRSSIKTSQKEQTDKNKQSDMESIASNLSNKLKEYDTNIQNLRDEEAVALDNLDLTFAQKLQSEIDKLLEQRQQEINDINKYNNDLKQKELKYKEDRAKAIEEQLVQRMKDELEIKKLEEENGYAGEKAENYQQRYDMAYEFYSGLPKDVAVKMLNENAELRTYLGLYYGKLVNALASK